MDVETRNLLNDLLALQTREDTILNANDNIFEYFCSGNNRDGLAIKATCQDLLKRRKDNKILIVLSDGRPNDIKVGKGQVADLHAAYRGRAAIEDTAREVRLARQQGILVLGVFTGKERDFIRHGYWRIRFTEIVETSAFVKSAAFDYQDRHLAGRPKMPC